jgi:hypothetical protein
MKRKRLTVLRLQRTKGAGTVKAGDNYERRLQGR